MPSSRRWRPGAATIRRASRTGMWVLAGVGVVLVLAGAAWLIWKVPPALYSYVPDPKDRAGAESTTRTGLIAGLAGLAALGSLAVTARTYRLSLRTYGLSLESQLTDRYTKAVAQLGDDKLAIRQGGIYALERLAVDSPRDHPTVVEVLSAYVRERTRATPRIRPPGRRTAHPLRLTSSPEPLAVDIQAALTVLGRLPALPPGVRRADLSGADLTEANLSGADLTAANLSGADLTEADLSGADLTAAFLARTNLTEAFLIEANLSEAFLPDADLTAANLAGADLTAAHVFKANLTQANLYEANLTRADLADANLTEAFLYEATLTAAILSGADLAQADGLGPDQLATARGDEHTVLPDGLTRPTTWTSQPVGPPPRAG